MTDELTNSRQTVSKLAEAFSLTKEFPRVHSSDAFNLTGNLVLSIHKIIR